MTNPVLNQVSFRARNDDVSLNSTTFTHALNANFTQAVDVPFRVRFTIAETAGGMANNIAFSVQYNLAGAGFVAIGDTAAVRSAQSALFVNGAATTQIISTGAFVAGIGVEQTTTSNITLQSQRTEIEWCLSIDSMQVAHGQTLTLRIVQASGTVLDTYTQTPTITVENSVVNGAGVGALAATTGAADGEIAIVGVVAGTLASASGDATGAFVPDEVTGTGAGTLTASTGSATGVFSGTGPTEITIELWQNGTKLTSETTVEVSSESGEIVTLDFDASELTGAANVEVRLFSGGNAVEIGAVEWGAFLTGDLVIDGSFAGVLAAAVGTASGFVEAIGAVVGTLEPAEGAAAGELAILGTAAGTLASITGQASGSVLAGVAGSAAGSLAAATGAATGLVEAIGTAAGTLAVPTGDAQGELTIAGAAAGVLAVATGSASGQFLTGVAGDGIAALAASTGAATGLVEALGTAAGALEATEADADAAFGPSGQAEGTLAATTGAAAGTLATGATADGTLAAATGAATGNVIQFVGTAAGQLAAATGDALGSQEIDGAGDGDLEATEGSATGWAEVIGIGDGALRAVQGASTGINSTGIPTPPSRVITVPARRSLTVQSRNRLIYVLPKQAA